jgi:predicted nucleic acid-binding protein
LKILDTTFIFDLLRGIPEAVRKAEELDEGREAVTTAISVYELFFGLFSSEAANKKRRMLEAERFFSRLEVLPLNYEAAKLAGEILSGLSNEGKLIDVMDGMIGAIGLKAAGNDVDIVTRNRAHFKSIKGIKIINY